MTPKKLPVAKAILNDREQKQAALAWQCLEGDFKIDIQKWAQLSGYDKPATAVTMWRRLKGKLLSVTPEDGNEAAENGGSQAANSNTPAKAALTPNKRPVKGKKKSDDTEDELDEEPIAGALSDKKPNPRKRKTPVKKESQDKGDAAYAVTDNGGKKIPKRARKVEKSESVAKDEVEVKDEIEAKPESKPKEESEDDDNDDAGKQLKEEHDEVVVKT